MISDPLLLSSLSSISDPREPSSSMVGPISLSGNFDRCARDRQCLYRLLLVLNAIPQGSHRKGRSFVCRRMCFSSTDGLLQFSRQYGHIYFPGIAPLLVLVTSAGDPTSSRDAELILYGISNPGHGCASFCSTRTIYFCSA